MDTDNSSKIHSSTLNPRMDSHSFQNIIGGFYHLEGFDQGLRPGGEQSGVESWLWMTGSSWFEPLVGISTEPYFTGQDSGKVGAARILSVITSGGPSTDKLVAPRLVDGESTWPPGD
jgi:hypothetical protein